MSRAHRAFCCSVNCNNDPNDKEHENFKQRKSESDGAKESSAQKNWPPKKLPLSMMDSSLIETVCPVAQLGFMCFWLLSTI